MKCDQSSLTIMRSISLSWRFELDNDGHGSSFTEEAFGGTQTGKPRVSPREVVPGVAPRGVSEDTPSICWRNELTEGESQDSQDANSFCSNFHSHDRCQLARLCLCSLRTWFRSLGSVFLSPCIHSTQHLI